MASTLLVTLLLACTSRAAVCAAPTTFQARVLAAQPGRLPRHGSPEPQWLVSSALAGTDPWALGGLHLTHGSGPPPAPDTSGGGPGAAARRDALRDNASPHSLGAPRAPSILAAGQPQAPPPRQTQQLEPLPPDGGAAAAAAPHKPLWPLSRADAALFIVTAAVLVLAASGGIGGGALYVPLLIFVGRFPTSQAVALSNAAIVGGAFANLLLNWRRPHPLDPARPLIDWCDRPRRRRGGHGVLRVHGWPTDAELRARAQRPIRRAASRSGLRGAPPHAPLPPLPPTKPPPHPPASGASFS